jgi:hypothetical protein
MGELRSQGLKSWMIRYPKCEDAKMLHTFTK